MEEEPPETQAVAAAVVADAVAVAVADSSNNNNSNNNSAAAAAVVSPVARRLRHHDRPAAAEEEKEAAAAAAATAAASAIRIGQVFYKRFEDGAFYEGRVVSGPEEVIMVMEADVKDDGGGSGQRGERVAPCWRVRYADDGQEEDLTAAEISEWPGEDPAAAGRKSGKKRAKLSSSSSGGRGAAAQYEKARTSLLWLPGIREDEALEALAKIGPPYGLQAAVSWIHAARRDPDNYRSGGAGDKTKFVPHVGLKVRMSAGGAQYLGEVTSEGRLMEVDDEGHRLRLWEVTYEDGTQDDLDWYQLLQARADRPVRAHPCRGRQLGCLELFSGCGAVSQAFAERRWLVRSVDSDAGRSNATDRVDVMRFEPGDVGFVPDFAWASPPCFTYSIMAGGKHRKAETQEFEKTREAREHNHIFARMAKILHQAKARHPHLIVVIENPVGLLAKMPLMAELERSLGLYRTTVDYCAFGRSDKKPTHLWTNDYGLHATLSEFKCGNRCPYKDGIHPISARQQGSQFNAAAIPEALAEEVAEYVHAKFVLDRIRYTKEVVPVAAALPEEGGGDGTNTITSSEGAVDASG